MSPELDGRVRKRLARPALVIFVFGILAAGVSWRVLAGNGMIGHHWDWGLPSSAAELRNMARSTRYAWYPVSLGSFVSFRYGITPLEAILGIPGYLGVSGAAVAKAMLFIDIWCSGVAMYTLVRTLSACHRRAEGSLSSRWHGEIPSLVSGAMYMASAFQFDQIIAGDIGGLAAFALLPFAVALLWRGVAFTHGATRRHLVGAGLVFGAAFACSTQPSLMAAVLAVVPLLIILRQRLLLLAKAALVGAIALFMNVFWLLPALASSRAVTTASAVTPSVGDPYAHYGTLLGSLQGWTYFVPFLWDSLSAVEQHVLAGMDMFLLLTAIAVLIFLKRGVSNRAYLLGVFLVVELGGAVLLAAPASALGAPARLVLQAPLASLVFRTPQHLVFPVAFLSPVLIGVAMQRLVAIATRSERKLRWLPPPTSLAMCASALVVVAAFPLSRAITQYIGPFPQSSASVNALAYLNSHGSAQGRLLELPGGTSEYFQSHPPGELALDAGDDGDAIWDVHPSLALDGKWNPSPAARTAQQVLVDQLLTAPAAATPLLDMLAVQYIEIAPVLGPQAGALGGTWNEEAVVHSLQGDRDLEEVFAEGGWYIFTNRAFGSQLYGVPANPRTGNILTDLAVSQVLQSPRDSEAQSVAVFTANNYLRHQLSPSPGGPLVATRTKLRVVRGSTGALTYGLPPSLVGCDFSNPLARLTFEARASTSGKMLVLIPDGSNESRTYEALLAIGQHWASYTIPLDQFTQVDRPGASALRVVRVIPVGDSSMASNSGNRITVRRMVMAAPRPTEACAPGETQNWTVGDSIAPAGWNYSQGVVAPFASTDGFATPGNRLLVSGAVPRTGTYNVEAVVVAPGDGWSIRWRLAGSAGTINGAGSGNGNRYQLIPVGQVNLDAGTAVATLNARCAAQCQLGVVGLVAVERSQTATAPGCLLWDAREHNPGSFTVRAQCPSGGILALSETSSGQWRAVATASGRDESVVLGQRTLFGWEDGWQVPPGNWILTIQFTPQGIYEVSQILALAFVAGLVVYLLAGRTGAAAGRRGRDR